MHLQTRSVTRRHCNKLQCSSQKHVECARALQELPELQAPEWLLALLRMHVTCRSLEGPPGPCTNAPALSVLRAAIAGVLSHGDRAAAATCPLPQLVARMRFTARLRCIHLSHLRVADAEWRCFASGLQSAALPALRSFALEDSNADSGMAEDVAWALCARSHLEHASLARNRIDMAGAEVLIASLAGMPALARLDLSGNGIEFKPPAPLVVFAPQTLRLEPGPSGRDGALNALLDCVMLGPMGPAMQRYMAHMRPRRGRSEGSGSGAQQARQWWPRRWRQGNSSSDGGAAKSAPGAMARPQHRQRARAVPNACLKAAFTLHSVHVTAESFIGVLMLARVAPHLLGWAGVPPFLLAPSLTLLAALGQIDQLLVWLHPQGTENEWLAAIPTYIVPSASLFHAIAIAALQDPTWADGSPEGAAMARRFVQQHALRAAAVVGLCVSIPATAMQLVSLAQMHPDNGAAPGPVRAMLASFRGMHPYVEHGPLTGLLPALVAYLSVSDAFVTLYDWVGEMLRGHAAPYGGPAALWFAHGVAMVTLVQLCVFVLPLALALMRCVLDATLRAVYGLCWALLGGPELCRGSAAAPPPRGAAAAGDHAHQERTPDDGASEPVDGVWERVQADALADAALHLTTRPAGAEHDAAAAQQQFASAARRQAGQPGPSGLAQSGDNLAARTSVCTSKSADASTQTGAPGAGSNSATSAAAAAEPSSNADAAEPRQSSSDHSSMHHNQVEGTAPASASAHQACCRSSTDDWYGALTALRSISEPRRLVIKLGDNRLTDAGAIRLMLVLTTHIRDGRAVLLDLPGNRLSAARRIEQTAARNALEAEHAAAPPQIGLLWETQRWWLVWQALSSAAQAQQAGTAAAKPRRLKKRPLQVRHLVLLCGMRLRIGSDCRHSGTICTSSRHMQSRGAVQRADSHVFPGDAMAPCSTCLPAQFQACRTRVCQCPCRWRRCGRRQGRPWRMTTGPASPPSCATCSATTPTSTATSWCTEARHHRSSCAVTENWCNPQAGALLTALQWTWSVVGADVVALLHVRAR